MSNEVKRRIKLDLRRSLDSPDSQFMMMMLDPEARKIRDFVNMIKEVCPGLEDCEDVKVYQGKYLLPPDVDIDVIKTQEDVIIIHNPNSKDVVVKKEYCEEIEKKIQMKIASTQTDAAINQPIAPQPPAKIVGTQANATPNQPTLVTTKPQKVTGIESLGKNTVIIKDGQLIVQGPNQADATAIARKLASGEAKLGNVAGKQVLVCLGEKRSIQQEKGGPNNNNDASSTTPSAKRLCTDM